MIDLNKLVRDNVLKLTPYSSARDEFSGKSGIFLDANENPYGSLNRYPDPYQTDLRQAVAVKKGVPPERVFLGNGSDEIIDLTCRIFCNPGKDRIIIFPPTYGMYEVSAAVNDIDVIRIPLDSDFQVDTAQVEPWLRDESVKVIFICSPNNPTANSIRMDAVEYILDNFHGIVVIDEAYIDFSDKPSLLGISDRYDNLVVMHTFSKAWGLAAVRVGMAFSTPEILSFYNKMKPPYNISTVNQEAALRRLENDRDYNEQIGLIKKERVRLAANLEKIRCVEKVYPSDANFLLVKVNDATNIYQRLVGMNIIVRNRTSHVNNCLRITVGTTTENDELTRALNTIQ